MENKVSSCLNKQEWKFAQVRISVPFTPLKGASLHYKEIRNSCRGRTNITRVANLKKNIIPSPDFGGSYCGFCSFFYFYQLVARIRIQNIGLIDSKTSFIFVWMWDFVFRFWSWFSRFPVQSSFIARLTVFSIYEQLTFPKLQKLKEGCNRLHLWYPKIQEQQGHR